MLVKIILISLGSIVFFVTIFLLWAASPLSLNSKVVEGKIIKLSDANFKPETNTLKILTLNSSFFYGSGSEGTNYTPESKEYFDKKLSQGVVLINRLAPDLAFFQEIDFASARTHDQDQLKELASRAGYNYAAYAVSWMHNYIPFPYFPIRSQFGHMLSGGGIISKYPIVHNQVYLLGKPRSNPWWYNLFYLYRYIQVVTIETPKGKFKVMNVHLEAFDKLNRKEQMEQLNLLIAEHKPWVIAGDFNTLPEKAGFRSGFKNSDDNYEGDYSIKILKTTMTDCLDEAIYRQNESNYFTFPATKPDRKLDYIFHDKKLKTVKCHVERGEDLNLSDHLPFYAEIVAFEPEFIRD